MERISCPLELCLSGHQADTDEEIVESISAAWFIWKPRLHSVGLKLCDKALILPHVKLSLARFERSLSAPWIFRSISSGIYGNRNSSFSLTRFASTPPVRIR